LLFPTQSASNSLGTSTGQPSALVTQIGIFRDQRIEAFFFNAHFEIAHIAVDFFTSAQVNSLILGCFPTSDIFGPSMHIEQSIVGKCLVPQLGHVPQC